MIILATLAAHIDLLKLHCTREEVVDKRTYFSEIHFEKSNDLDHDRTEYFEGELTSYYMSGSKKKFISGFNFFRVAYHKGVVSGMIGDSSRTEGSFTLTQKSSRVRGAWMFVYSTPHQNKIEAEFKCTYPIF